jgi:hypothetical protein
MNKLRVSVLVAFSFVVISCGGGGGGSTSGDSASGVSLSGVATDGPIYGATVEIFAKNDTTFSNPLGSATTSESNATIGEYAIAGIQNLPAEYIVRVSGGKDAGPDGIKNNNDETSFEMLSVASYNKDTDGESVRTHISPATTLVAKLVVNGTDINTAKTTIKTALGLPNDVDLAKDNPKENDTANKAGTVVAQLINSTGVSDKNTVLEAIAKDFQEKNTKLVDINDLEVNVDLVDFGDIATKIKEVNSNAISDSQIAKMQHTQTATLMKKMVKNTTQRIKAVNLLNESDTQSAIAAHKASLKIKQLIQDTDLIELNTDKLSNNYDTIEDNFATLVKDNIDNVTTDNFDIVASVIIDNKTTDTAKIIAIASQTKDVTGDKKQLIKQIYTHTDISEIDKIRTMDLSNLDNLLLDNTSENLADSTKQEMYKMAAIKLGSELKTKEIAAINMDDIANKTTKNEVLKTTIKDIANNKTQGSAEQIHTDKLLLDNLEKNFSNDSFEFDENAKQNIEALETQVKDKITVILNSNSSLDDIFKEIKKVEIASKMQDLNNFDNNNFNSNVNSIDNLINTFYDNTQENSDIFESINEIEDHIYIKVDSGDNLGDIISDINTNIDDYIKEKSAISQIPEVIIPPRIGGFDFSQLLENIAE